MNNVIKGHIETREVDCQNCGTTFTLRMFVMEERKYNYIRPDKCPECKVILLKKPA